MSILKTTIIPTVLLLTATGFSKQASAQINETTPNIEYAQIVVTILSELVFPIILAVATYLINAHVKNKQMANLPSNAVQNGLGIVQQKTAAAIVSKSTTITTGSPDIDAGVQYVLDNADEAIKHFNIPRERIAEKIVAKLGLAEIATNLATTASTAPIIAGPLEPVP